MATAVSAAATAATTSPECAVIHESGGLNAAASVSPTLCVEQAESVDRIIPTQPKNYSNNIQLPPPVSTANVAGAAAAAAAVAIEPTTPKTTITTPLNVVFNASSDVEEMNRIPIWIRIIAMPVCIFIMAFGVLGNIMVPIVIMKTKDMRNSTNIFLTNLSIADLFVLLICTPTVLVELNTRPETWILGYTLCKLVPFVELTVAHASVLTILAISFERYYAICEPLKAGYVCTKARAVLICAVTWSIAALFTSPILWVAEYKFVEYIDGSSVAVCLTQAISNWTVGFFISMTSVFFILPLIILIVLYGIIAKNLISKTGLTMMRIRPTKPELSLKARKQVVLMLGAVVFSFFLCLLPFRLLTMWIILSSEATFFDIGVHYYYGLLYFCRIMLYLNSAINPLLYNLMSTKFRKGFGKLIGSAWNGILGTLGYGTHAKRENTGAGGGVATNNTTSSNTATTTSSSILSRSSNRRTSTSVVDDNLLLTKTRVQIQMQMPCGSDSEMVAMLHANDLVVEVGEDKLVGRPKVPLGKSRKTVSLKECVERPLTGEGRRRPQISFDETKTTAMT